MNHRNYSPVVVYKEFVNSNFAREILGKLPSFNCEDGKKGITKLCSDLFYKRPFRRITPYDVRNISEFLRKSDVRIIHYHYGTDAGVFTQAAARLNLPSVVSFYGYDCSSFPRWYFGLGAYYLRKVFANTNYCLAMSKDMETDLLRIGCPSSKIIVHYYGTDVQQFYCKRKYTDRNDVIFLMVASLVPQKGHFFALAGLKRALRLTSKSLKLRIIGEGPLESELIRYVEENDLSNHVHFTGALNYLSSEFLREYSNAHVFVHPSVVSETQEKEGIPGTIVEAMASGLPVLSTYHAGIPSIITNDNTGLLVDEWDICKLAKCMVVLAESPHLRSSIGRKAQKYALAELDLNIKEKELEDIYNFAIR